MITARILEATHTPEGAVLHLEIVIPADTPTSPEAIAQAVAQATGPTLTPQPTPHPQRLPIHYCHPDIVRYLAPPQAAD